MAAAAQTLLISESVWMAKYRHLSPLIKALEVELFHYKHGPQPNTKAEYAERAFAEGLIKKIQQAIDEKNTL